MNWKKPIKGIARGIAYLFFAALLVALLVLGVVQTDQGKDYLMKTLQPVLAEKKVRIGKLSGILPFHFQVDHLAIADSHGDWLVLKGIQVHWSPLHLLKGDIRFLLLGADAIKAVRRPESTAAKPREGKTGGLSPFLLQRLRLEHFFVHRLDLGEALVGRQASFAIKADMVASSREGFLETGITIHQLAGGNARFTAKTTWSPNEEELLVEARLEEPAGGVLAGAMGFEGPLLFSLDGKGTVKDWKGRMMGSVTPLGTMDSRVHLSQARGEEVTFSGSFKINRNHLPEALVPWVSEEASLTLTARRESRERVALERLALETAQNSLELKGLLDLSAKNSRVDFSLACRDLSPVGFFMNSKPSGALTATGTLAGSPWWPSGVLDVRLENPAVSGMRASGVESRWEIDPLDAGGSFPSRFQVKGQGRITDPVLPQTAVLFPKWIGWSGEAEVSPGEPVRLRRLLLDSEKVSTALAGEVDPLRAKGHLDLSLEIHDSTVLSDFLGTPLPFLAGTSLRGNVKGDFKEEGLTGSIQGRTKVIGKAIPALAPIVSGEVRYSLGFSFSGNREVVLSGVEIRTAGVTVKSDLSLDLSGETLKSRWDISLPNLNLLSAALKQPVEGSLSVQGTTEGVLRSPKTLARFRGEGLLVHGTALEKASAEMDMTGLPPHSSGSFSLNLLHRKEPFFSEGRYDLDGTRLHLSHLSFRGAGISLGGKVETRFEEGSVEGELKASSRDLSALAALLGRDFSGSIEVDSTFRLTGEGQKVVLAASGKDLGGLGAQVQSARLRAELAGDYTAPSGTAKLSLTGLGLGDLDLAAVEATGQSDGNRIAYSARAKGSFRQAVEIEASGDVSPFSESREITIHRLEGFLGETPLALLQPTALAFSSAGFTLNEFLCSLGAGRLEGRGSFNPGQINLSSKFERLPLSLVGFFWSAAPQGVASGELALQGPSHEPEGKVEVQIDRFAFQGQLPSQLPPATLEFTGVLESRLLRSRLSVKGLTAEPFRASAEFPLNLSVEPFAVSVPPAGPLKGMLEGSMDLVRLTSFLSLADQSIQGKAKIALDLSGTPREPKVSGSILATNGVYENYRTGTIINEAEIEIEASNRELRIKHARGKDAENGTVTAGGWMSLDSAQAFPFKVDFAVRHAKLARLDEAVATMDGSGAFEGDFKKATFSGQFTVESSEFQIPKRLPFRLTELDVIEIHGKESEAKPYQPVAKKNGERGVSLFLDLSLRIPGRTLVSGRGMESEWEGDLTVKGEAAQPELKGKLSLVRGRFDLLSKRFYLTNGFISFSGATPPQPLLDVTGEARTKDLLARIQVSGFLQSLEIKLSSQPPYPADEILSHLLFGRRLDQITPVQAVQLADALNTLRGAEGFDLLGRTRKLLGVDELTVGDSGEAEEKPAVTIGKYLSENVYIKVEGGVSAETSKASVEWQVTPNVTVDTEVGVNASAGAGISWRWDY